MQKQETKGIIIDNIKTLLNNFRWTQTELAKQTGIAQGQISTLISGKHSSRPATLKSIANAFGVSYEYLLTDHRKEEVKPTKESNLENEIIESLDNLKIKFIDYVVQKNQEKDTLTLLKSQVKALEEENAELKEKLEKFEKLSAFCKELF